MPLIKFPDVPMVSGVPNINRSVIGVAVLAGISAIQKYDTFGLLSKFLGNVWAIVDDNGNPVVTPDSVLSFEYRNEQKISNYPIEKGSFQTYNKVSSPYDIRLRMTCNGQGQMTRDVFLATMQTMNESINLYSIVTPDATYTNCNVTHFDYRRESRNGVQMLTVDVWLQEVRTPSNAYNPFSVKPSGQKGISIGNVDLRLPTVKQVSAYAKSVFQ
jgi:hypothetical protein